MLWLKELTVVIILFVVPAELLHINYKLLTRGEVTSFTSDRCPPSSQCAWYFLKPTDVDSVLLSRGSQLRLSDDTRFGEQYYWDTTHGIPLNLVFVYRDLVTECHYCFSLNFCVQGETLFIDWEMNVHPAVIKPNSCHIFKEGIKKNCPSDDTCQLDEWNPDSGYYGVCQLNIMTTVKIRSHPQSVGHMVSSCLNIVSTAEAMPPTRTPLSDSTEVIIASPSITEILPTKATSSLDSSPYSSPILSLGSSPYPSPIPPLDSSPYSSPIPPLDSSPDPSPIPSLDSSPDPSPDPSPIPTLDSSPYPSPIPSLDSSPDPSPIPSPYPSPIPSLDSSADSSSSTSIPIIISLVVVGVLLLLVVLISIIVLSKVCKQRKQSSGSTTLLHVENHILNQVPTGKDSLQCCDQQSEEVPVCRQRIQSSGSTGLHVENHVNNQVFLRCLDQESRTVPGSDTTSLPGCDAHLCTDDDQEPSYTDITRYDPQQRRYDQSSEVVSTDPTSQSNNDAAEWRANTML